MPGDRYNAALVERVRSFVNTDDVQHDEDPLGSPEVLVTWVTEMGLFDDERHGADPPRASQSDVRLARELRETLRELLRHRQQGGRSRAGGPSSEAQRRVEQLSDQLPLRVELCWDGQPYLVPAVSGVRHSLARILAAVAAMSSDDWHRLKVCPADDCQWVFYDESRNRSRRWCSMEGCGNRSKVRSYRRRGR